MLTLGRRGGGSLCLNTNALAMKRGLTCKPFLNLQFANIGRVMASVTWAGAANGRNSGARLGWIGCRVRFRLNRGKYEFLVAS